MVFQRILKNDKSNLCPYCRAKLAEKPKRKKKCPTCGEDIFVRKGQLLTKDDADIADWLERVQQLGITRSDFNHKRQKLSDRFGKKASVNDTAWGILNELIVSMKKRENQKIIYLEMAHIAIIEGKDPTKYLAEAAKQDLFGYKALGIRRVKVYTTNDNEVCENCRKMSNKTYDIDQAIKDLPIPNNCKGNDFCRCWYSPE